MVLYAGEFSTPIWKSFNPSHCATQVRPYLFSSVKLPQGPPWEGRSNEYPAMDAYQRTEFIAKNKPVPPGLFYGKGDPAILGKLKEPKSLDECFKLLAQHYPAGSERGALPLKLAEFRDANFVRAPLLPPRPKHRSTTKNHKP